MAHYQMQGAVGLNGTEAGEGAIVCELTCGGEGQALLIDGNLLNLANLGFDCTNSIGQFYVDRECFSIKRFNCQSHWG